MSAAAAWSLAAALWLGCLAGGSLRGATAWLAGPAGLVLLLAALRAVSDRRRLALAVAALALLGAGLAGGRAAIAASAGVATWADRGGVADLEAVVVTEARDTERGAWQVVRVRDLAGVRVRERAVLALDGLDEAPDLGARVRLAATARPLGHSGFEGHLRRLHAVAWIDPAGPVEVARGPGRLLAATTRVRERTRAAAHRSLDHDRATLLTGLVTGDVRGQDPAQREAFRAAGLTHLVVVSGRHVGLFLAAVFGLATLAGLGARGRRQAALAALAWFVLVTRWQPSVLRAGTMAALALAAGLAGRRVDPRHGLAMAALLLLLADPMLAAHLGFVLSATATAGVLLAAPWLAEHLPGPRPLRLLVAACVGAQAGAAGVLLSLDDGLPLGSLPANLVAVPAAGLAQVIGLAAALTAQLSVAAGAALASLAGPLLSVVLLAAGTFSAAPSVTAGSLRSSLALAAALLAGAAVVVLLRLRRPGTSGRSATARGPAGRRPGRRIARLLAPVAVAAVTVVSLPGTPQPAAVDALALTLLDVGQGDAVLIEVPGEPEPARMLVDGGPEPETAWRHLRRLGVRRLDVVALSHPHHDHSGGLPQVLRRAGVAAFVAGPYPLDERIAPSAHEAYAVARERGIPIHRLEAGHTFRLGSGEVEVLSPPPAAPFSDDLNEISLVLRVVTPAGAVLLTGDAEVLAQSSLLGRPDRLAADVLKVPHHGGRTNAPGFFDAVGAQVALIGVGAGNDYGHPHPAVLDALAAAGARVYRTDLHGTVTARLRGGAVEVERERLAAGRLLSSLSSRSPPDGGPRPAPISEVESDRSGIRLQFVIDRFLKYSWKGAHNVRAPDRPVVEGPAVPGVPAGRRAVLLAEPPCRDRGDPRSQCRARPRGRSALPHHVLQQ